jgi:hypothetical protein
MCYTLRRMKSTICLVSGILLGLAAGYTTHARAQSTAAGAGADMLQQILRQKAEEDIAKEALKRGAAPPISSTTASAQDRNLTYRVIDGAVAKSIDNYCATLWYNNEEVLLIEYGSHTYLMRTGFGDIGRACRVR